MKKLFLALALTGVLAAPAGAVTITYVLPDIGTFAAYTNTTVSDTYAGDGFVGMYNIKAVGAPAWAHLLGLEDIDYSRTIGQVDVSALAGATINSATFSFDLLDGWDTTQNVTFGYFAEDGALSYNWAPALLGSSVYSATGKSSNAFDVTSELSSFLGGPNGNWFGFWMQGSSAYEWTYTYTGYGYTADRAKMRLTVDYTVPEPASLFLLGTGLAAVATGLRRKRS